MAVLEANNKRVVWIDYAKASCILLMVLCHAGLTGITAQVIYQFHMPAFFIISGLLYKNRGVMRELKSFIIPIVVLSMLNWIVGLPLYIISHDLSITEWGGYL